MAKEAYNKPVHFQHRTVSILALEVVPRILLPCSISIRFLIRYRSCCFNSSTAMCIFVQNNSSYCKKEMV